jgi:sugar lactone lactonase YvrE
MRYKPEILTDLKFEHPEGLVWNQRTGQLAWVDIFKGEVLSYHLETASLNSQIVGQVVGSVAPRQCGGYVCAIREGFGLLSSDGEFSSLTRQLRDAPYLQMNDGGVDARGRFWAGSMTFEFLTRPGAGALYRLDPDGTASVQLEEISVSNGIGWSPDWKNCYYVDSATRRIDRFEFDLESGTLGRRTTLAGVEAFPDGIAIDVDGCIWVAIFGAWEVRRFTPAGRVDRVIRLPGSQVTTCAFGGNDLRTLFIAVSPYGLSEEKLRQEKAGYIYTVNAGVQGLQTQEYAG